MADADLSHMGDNVMDTWLESYGRWHCRWMVQTVGVGADNVPRLELVSQWILFLILLLSNST